MVCYTMQFGDKHWKVERPVRLPEHDRMMEADVIALYNRVPAEAKRLVLGETRRNTCKSDKWVFKVLEESGDPDLLAQMPVDVDL